MYGVFNPVNSTLHVNTNARIENDFIRFGLKFNLNSYLKYP